MTKKATEANRASLASRAFDQPAAVRKIRNEILKPFNRWSRDTLNSVLSDITPRDDETTDDRVRGRYAYLHFDFKSPPAIPIEERDRARKLNDIYRKNIESELDDLRPELPSRLWIVRSPSHSLFVAISGAIRMLHVPDSVELFPGCDSISYEELDAAVFVKTEFREEGRQHKGGDIFLRLQTPHFNLRTEIAFVPVLVEPHIPPAMARGISTDRDATMDIFLMESWQGMVNTLGGWIEFTTNKKRKRRTGAKYEFAKDGFHWRGTYQGKTFTIPDSLGATYLRELLARPYRSIPCRDLFDQVKRPTRKGFGEGPINSVQAGEKRPRSEKLSFPGLIGVAHKHVEKAVAAGDLDRASGLNHELKSLIKDQERDDADGNGWDKSGTPEEGARKAVWAAINRVKKQIGMNSPNFQKYLDENIKTGFVLCYKPPKIINWKLE